MFPLGIHLNYFLFHMSESPYIYYALQIGTVLLMRVTQSQRDDLVLSHRASLGCPQ